MQTWKVEPSQQAAAHPLHSNPLSARHTLPHAACCAQEKPPAGVLSVQAVDEAHWPQEALQKPPSRIQASEHCGTLGDVGDGSRSWRNMNLVRGLCDQQPKSHTVCLAGTRPGWASLSPERASPGQEHPPCPTPSAGRTRSRPGAPHRCSLLRLRPGWPPAGCSARRSARTSRTEPSMAGCTGPIASSGRTWRRLQVVCRADREQSGLFEAWRSACPKVGHAQGIRGAGLSPRSPAQPSPAQAQPPNPTPAHSPLGCVSMQVPVGVVVVAVAAWGVQRPPASRWGSGKGTLKLRLGAGWTGMPSQHVAWSAWYVPTSAHTHTSRLPLTCSSTPVGLLHPGLAALPPAFLLGACGAVCHWRVSGNGGH